MAVKQTVYAFCVHCGNRTGRIRGAWLSWSPCDCKGPPGPPSYPRRVLANDFIFVNNGPVEEEGDSSEWAPIESAPTGGTVILGLYDEGMELIRYEEDRY